MFTTVGSIQICVCVGKCGGNLPTFIFCTSRYCHAWTYFTPYYYDYTYQWPGYCVGRSDYEKVDINDYDTWTGIRYNCGEAGKQKVTQHVNTKNNYISVMTFMQYTL